jgi:lysozyme
MKVSEAARRMIAKFEGCVLHAYPDPATGGDPWTIGYGHTAGVKPGQTITQAQADQMLATDLDKIYGPGVLAAIGNAPTTQNQFDAMTSLAFNIGVGAFEGSTVCRMHKAGNYEVAAEAFALWNRAAGRPLAALTRRRLAEAKLYLTAVEAQPQDAAPPVSASDAPNAISKIKAVQLVLGVEQDGDFGKISRAALNEVLAAAGQPGV